MWPKFVLILRKKQILKNLKASVKSVRWSVLSLAPACHKLYKQYLTVAGVEIARWPKLVFNPWLSLAFVSWVLRLQMCKTRTKCLVSCCAFVFVWHRLLLYSPAWPGSHWAPPNLSLKYPSARIKSMDPKPGISPILTECSFLRKRNMILGTTHKHTRVLINIISSEHSTVKINTCL